MSIPWNWARDEPWKRQSSPGGPRHPPNEAETRPLGALLLFSFCHTSSQRAWVTASREAGQGLPCPRAETNAWFVWGVAAVVPSVRD